MKTVLVVDDSPSIRNIVKVFLSGAPYEVIEAEDGERALKLLRLMRVDIVIADLNMPVMDGLALTQAVRASTNAKLRALPIILLTGEAHRSHQEALGYGVTAFLRKPISGRNLLDALSSVQANGSGDGAPAAR